MTLDELIQPDTDSEPKDQSEIRYQAFISYAREDARIARKLHKALENYHLPLGFGASSTLLPKAERGTLYPCFLDAAELRSGALSEQIQEAIQHSGALIVLCSRLSASNEWVNAEITEFLKSHSPDRIFPVLIDDTTLVENDVEEIFPSALRLAIFTKGGSSAPMTGWQPLAADMRLGRDGFALSVLKLVAGIKKLMLRDLAERQFRRARNRRLAISFALALIVIMIMIMIMGAHFLGQTIQSTGYQEIHSKADNSLAQLAAWQRLQDIISMGGAKQSREALVGFDADCGFTVGACGYYDEEYGYTAQRIRTATEESAITSDDIAGLLPELRTEISKDFELYHRVLSDPSPDIPEIMLIRRNFSASGSMNDRQENRYLYVYKTLDPREKYFRVSYALIPYVAVPDIQRGNAIRTWGTWAPIALFLLHFLLETLRFGRLFTRREATPKTAGMP